jgi:membrane-bound lytic murein transglycosylase D
MKILKTVLTASLFTAMMFSFSNRSSAQIINSPQEPVVTVDYDPIAATLDSLLNLTYVQRLSATSSFNNNGNFKPSETPVYADDIYRKRIQKIQSPIPLCFNSEVKEYINLYAVKKRGLTERVMGLSGLYFPLYEQILDQQGLPLEFKYLSIVESALNPTAVSPVGATGLWQFMYGTGVMYHLKINSFIDERRDPAKATYAACQYFKDMYAIYNDWLLVIAAYNCGAGNVNKAIARSGGKKTFWEISRFLPKETRGYVPAFIAVTYLMNYTPEHNLTAVPPLISYFEADTVMVDQRVTLRDIADATATPIELLTYLNPIYKKGIIPDGNEPMPLRLPSNKINTFLANMSNIFRPEDEATAQFASNEADYGSDLIQKTHKVKKGEHLQTIAKKYHCTVADLKQWNGIRKNTVRAGQRLTVYMANKNQKLAAKPAQADKTVAVVAKPKAEDAVLVTESKSVEVPAQIPSADKMKFAYHTVQPGDTLWKIAQRYEGMTVQQIKKINRLATNDLKVGTKLKIIINS